MLSRTEWIVARDRALLMLQQAGVVLTATEAENMEVADFGLERLEEFGLELITYINTPRVCAKELVLFPWQVCPEHIHPRVNSDPGKEETFRCRWGEVYLYVEGVPVESIKARLPQDRAAYFTVRHEIILRPGEQYTLAPQTWHWFQAGPQGAIVSEFSTHSTDENDLFRDPAIQRLPVIE